MIELRVTLPSTSEREYPIVIGRGILEDSASYLGAVCLSRRAVVVSDDTVWALHGDGLAALLRKCGIVYEPVVVPAGEQSKSLACLATLYETFCSFQLHRNDTVIAFGGGVVGDLAGFAAATFMRGVPFVQIPTTLMAQVDSSVGGKVAVNLPQGKNLAGCFYQPQLVIADISLLETLDKRDRDAGMAEVVKYAVLGNERLRDIFKEPVDDNSLTEIVSLCCSSKAGFVSEDEGDTGVRILLNLGHTFAHAIEAYYGYGQYRHGEAVATGMLLAAQVGHRLGISAPGTFLELKNMLDNAQIDRRLTENIEEGATDYLPLIRGDKKNLSDGKDTSSDEISLVLLRKIGDPFVQRIPYRDLHKLFGHESAKGKNGYGY